MLYYFPFYNGIASAVTRIQEGLGEKRMNDVGLKKKIIGREDFKIK